MIDPSWLNDRSDYQQNFVHRLRNPFGLQLQFELDGDRVVTTWTADHRHAGLPLGVPLRFEGWTARMLRRAMHAEGRALMPDGAEVAHATGTYLPLPAQLERRVVAAWPGFADYLS